MESIIYGLIFLLIIIFFVQRMVPAKGVQQIDASELKQLLKKKKDYEFIDVRTPFEFNSNKIKGFKNIPLQQLKQRLDELEQEKHIVVLCQSGMRSNRAAKILKKRGFPNVINVRGGIVTYR